MAGEMAYVERTLVKSPPELWELVDDPALMRQWTADLLGEEVPQAIQITERLPGEKVAWRSAGSGQASVELELAEKGWGTNVSIQAEAAGREEQPEAVLERLLDELSVPQRRPFARN